MPYYGRAPLISSAKNASSSAPTSGYDINTENPNTDYHSGYVFHIDTTKCAGAGSSRRRKGEAMILRLLEQSLKCVTVR